MTLNNKGQLSIFFGTTMLVVIGLIAFIINIGYFVKAKINLQNAVDAAAYAGASVQARQLSNIAYLNWEMRNVYKEWMYKYYVLGNLNTDAVKGDSSQAANFKMKSAPGDLTSDGGDQYNVPSICIDFANTGDVGICNLYKVPGLPRFESYNVQGMTETTNAIIDAIVAEKSGDCSKRSALNYSTATLWAYNITPKEGTTSLISDSPAIATDRQGAFPSAFELAIRMRNLEKQVNKAPYSEGVCMHKASFNDSFCATPLSDIVGTEAIGNERINKAYLSAWRNLGGDAPNDILKSSFTLKEITPTPYEYTNFSLSGLLIPGEKKYPKYYLDLKLLSLNLATFYTAFVTRLDKSSGVPKEGECEATKIGLPVPGYPLGFVKNPNVLTYYAVKGEANFIGLFNPFDIKEGIKLTAVAAAKPFGGRIGPNLFNVKGNETTQVLPLGAPGPYISSGYALGLKKEGNSASFEPGDPLPIADFWQSSEDQAIGGWINPESIRFVIPNLIYDYPTAVGDPPESFLSSRPIKVVTAGTDLSLESGLYNGDILGKFKQGIDLGNGLTPDLISKSILSARAPTTYDLTNYMVPTPEEINEELSVNSFGVIPTDSQADNDVFPVNKTVYNYEIYAPIFSDDEDTLYTTVGEVIGVFEKYILQQGHSITQYLNSMKKTASNIYTSNYSTASGDNTGVTAANIIADIPASAMNSGQVEDAQVSCNSIAGKFVYFYTGNQSLVRNDESSCDDIDTLPKMLREYWSQNKDKLGEYYPSQFVSTNNADMKKKYFNAYGPSLSKDTNAGQFINNLRSNQVNMARNYYSTKFVPLNSLTGATGYSPSSNFAIFSTGAPANTNSSFQAEDLSNPLNPQSVGFENDKISH